MLDAAVAASAFGVTFLAELPDKSVFASLLLGSRYRPAHVWVGTAAAFAAQVAIAVSVGQAMLALLPAPVVRAVVAALFIAAAGWLLATSRRAADDGRDQARQGGSPPSFPRVAATSFAVVFTAEWGDITQVTTANLAARYGAPVSVGVGALLALWVLAALAVTVGTKSLDVIPMPWVRRITAAVLLALGVYSAVTAALG